MINQTISHYKILEKLGEGGMGVVYKAQDLRLDRLVALKFLPEKLVADATEKERFIHEAKAASALNHPNVTTIYEIDEHQGQLFIVMEYCPGQSVKELIEGEKMTLKKTLDIAIQICEGLTAAHKKDVIHRDIKSDNIMVTPEGRVKIMDFGLAKLKGATKLTSTGSTLGTVSYMSPEQAQAMEVDQRSDIFSFGVVLYEMITGHLPFRGDHEAAVIYSIVNETPEPLARYKSNVPDGLQRIVDKALEKDREERYQHIDGVLADLRHEKRILESATAGRIPPKPEAPKPKKAHLSVIIPAAVIALAVILFFIIKPFQVKIGPQQEAVAQENSLAIMYFENLADREDEARLGEIATNLLIADLTESRYVQVVSSQRLYDILKGLGQEGVKVIDKDIASQVARKANAKWMLLGSILQVEPQIILMAQLVEVATGNAIASQRINGEEGEKIFSIVDKLTIEVKKDLSLPVQAQREKDPRVADVTTHSPEAYRYFLEGNDYYYKYAFREAERSYRQALKHDSTFAMAYYGLSLTRSLGWQAQLASIEKAVRYLDRVSSKEKHFILASRAALNDDIGRAIKELENVIAQYPDEKEAYFRLARLYQGKCNWEKAIAMLLKVIEIDPLFKEAYNVLAYIYNYNGEPEKSIWAVNKYIEIAPNEPNPYDTQGDFYRFNGKPVEAMATYREALKIDPDFIPSLQNLGDMYLLRREYQKAESLYQVMASYADKSTRGWGRCALADILIHQGKLQQALRLLDIGLETDRIELGESMSMSYKLIRRAYIYECLGEFELAILAAKESRDILLRTNPIDFAIVYRKGYVPYLFVKNGELSKAEASLVELNKDREKYGYWLLQGQIECAKENFSTAAAYLEKSNQLFPVFIVQVYIARCYSALGRLGDAVSMFENALRKYDGTRVENGITAAKTHYWLGLAYERSGWTDKAIEQYETFLDIWKDSDPGIEEVEDARERLARLKSAS